MNHTSVYNNCMSVLQLLCTQVWFMDYHVFVLTKQLLYTQVWFMHYHVFVLTIQLLYTQVWFMDYRVFVQSMNHTCVYSNSMVSTNTR
jgi:hypothetical protein